MKNILFIISLSIILLSASSDYSLDRWGEFSRSTEKSCLTKWIRSTALSILDKNKTHPPLDFTPPASPESTGMFITLIRKGKVRGCFGAFSHSSGDFSEILRYYIKGALSLDPRYRPLEKHELDETDIILTVTSNPEPVDSINNVDISNFGLFIECEDSSKMVIVPAEYRTTSSVMKLTVNSRCRFHKFNCVTIK